MLGLIFIYGLDTLQNSVPSGKGAVPGGILNSDSVVPYGLVIP